MQVGKDENGKVWPVTSLNPLSGGAMNASAYLRFDIVFHIRSSLNPLSGGAMNASCYMVCKAGATPDKSQSPFRRGDECKDLREAMGTLAHEMGLNPLSGGAMNARLYQ